MSDVPEAILARLNTIVVLVNREGKVEYVSTSVKEVLGFQPEQLLGEGWWNLTRDSEKERQAMREYVKQLAGNQMNCNQPPFERLLKTAGGSSKWILWNTAEGPGNTLVGIGCDITSRKEAEQALEFRNKILSERNGEIMDSIRYASHIQEAILPDLAPVKAVLPGLLVYYQPKDVVSGDFYWFHINDDQVFAAAIDCTGHGVPGALLSVIANALLRDIVIRRGLNEPSAILSALDEELTLAMAGEDGVSARDGFDIALCRIDIQRNLLLFSGAFRPLIHIRGNELTEYSGERFPIGYFFGLEKVFRTTEITIEKGDQIYMFSDGYTDQFGGENIRKFNRKRFRNLLLSLQDMNAERQQTELHDTFNSWKGNSEQVDDVCIIGVKL